MKILIVCMGNICRSPTAEAVLRYKLKEAGSDDVVVDSAGTEAYHIGEGPDSRSRQVAEARGYDFTGIKARQVESDDFSSFDLILAADNDNLRILLSQCPKRYQHKVKLMMSYCPQEGDVIPDPYYGGADGFGNVLDLIEVASDAIVQSTL